MENTRLYVDIHVLQTLPPSCVNRDDTGSPKTAEYGGATRARVSSQAWKKAVRTMFLDIFPKELLGTRSLKVPALLAELLQAAGVDQADKKAKALFDAAGIKLKEDKTGALFFVSQAQLQALVQLVLDNPDAKLTELKKEARAAFGAAPGIDIALFGRMVADDPGLNTDAAAQVAHALSTHRISNEYDYFTAVDDQPEEEHAGAGHMGTVEFNSATYYRYATVAVHVLKEQLGPQTAAAVKGFIKAFALSMPTGKQNTFANRTLPEAVLVTLRHDQPVNLVGAFERPVPASVEGYAKASAQHLVAYANSQLADFAGQPARALVTGALLAELGEQLPFDQLLNTLEAELAKPEQP